MRFWFFSYLASLLSGVVKAAAFYEYGGPEVLRIVEIDDPKPGDNDVIVRVPCTSVNPLDILVRIGRHGLRLGMPHVPGCDVAGRVEAVGKSVKSVSTGDRVIANTVFGCSRCRYCLQGDEISCKDWKTIGLQTNGAYGELVKVPEANLITPPKGYSDDELACLPISLSIAWRALSVLAKAEAGETVLVRAASGNAGLFCVMLAKALGLNVIALTRGSGKKERLLRLGADHVLDYSTGEEGLAKELMEITNGNGADIVIESFGSTLSSSVMLSQHGGRIIVFGTVTGLASEVKVMPLYLKNLSVFGSHNANKKEFADALGFISKHKIRPVMARSMKISEAADAHRLFESYSLFGKIVLRHR